MEVGIKTQTTSENQFACPGSSKTYSVMRCTCSICPPTGGCLVIGVIVTIVSEAGGGGSSNLIL
eukprot:scaffold80646_cov31-Attheya_sp.AAC.3